MLFAGKRILLTALALPLVAALGACDSDETTVVRGGSYLLELTDCQGFFGAPNEHSGIGEESCSSVCVCAEGEFAPHYDETFITSLREWELINPPGELTEDPYLNPDDYPRRDDEFCGVIVEDRENKAYRLATFESLDALHEAGGILTHTSACGACSSLASLALLIEMPDQTGPIRDCGILGLAGDQEKVVTCLKELGFETACAQINAHNTRHTRDECGSICFPLLNAPYHDQDGSLNDCIQCDEDKSGDIFRAVAGRARRNSGIGAALCRPCDDMIHLIHEYTW